MSDNPIAQGALEIVRGRTYASSTTINAVIERLQSGPISGTLYVGYPILASSDGQVPLDMLLVSRENGLVVLILQNEDEWMQRQDEIYFGVVNYLALHQELRQGRNLAIRPQIVTVFPTDADLPTTDGEYLAASLKTINDVIAGFSPITSESLYRSLNAAIHRVVSIKPRKRRANVTQPGTKGAILKRIEKEIANLDKWQNFAAIETPNCPQRIRGLAGSGKTIVLALKAAYLHAANPDWKIAVTFHTRSLYQQFKDTIERIVYSTTGDKPDWTKLHIMHSWGGSDASGIYSQVAESIGLSPYTYLAAKARYGNRTAFEGVCNELASALGNKELELYDAVLIDEAQDLPKSFFRIIYQIVKRPKRIIFAYDELQNLSDAVMQPPQELFGKDISFVASETEAVRDIVLPVCYRNTPWTLATAHALGFGIYAKELVQHFDYPEMWTQIGYELIYGSLQPGSDVSLRRAQTSYPEYFNEIGPEDSVQFYAFDDIQAQYTWIAEQVATCIKTDELDPDDILIILPNPLTQREEYEYLRRHLSRLDIEHDLVGVSTSRDIFRREGRVTVSGIHRAKGNEAPMVFIANADYCAVGNEMIRLRNILFTAMTRSQGWLRVCGVGDRMNVLIEESRQVVTNDFALNFRMPTMDEIQVARRRNRDLTTIEADRVRTASESLKVLQNLIAEGTVRVDSIDGLRELVDQLKRGIRTSNSEEDEEV